MGTTQSGFLIFIYDRGSRTHQQLPNSQPQPSSPSYTSSQPQPRNFSASTNKDKLRFYAIARGSAMQCAAICDVLVLTEPRLKSSAEPAKGVLEQIPRILTTICSKN